MYVEPVTVELPKLELPADLVTEISRGGKMKTDFRVEGWKPSLFGRLVDKLVGKSSR